MSDITILSIIVFVLILLCGIAITMWAMTSEELKRLRKASRQPKSPYHRHYALLDIKQPSLDKLSKDELASLKWELARIIAKRITKYYEPIQTTHKGKSCAMYDFDIRERLER